jgi:DedD protein
LGAGSASDSQPESHIADTGGREVPRQSPLPAVEKPPAYALTAFSIAEPRSMKPKAAVALSDTARMWMVQVASLAAKRDAEALAANLRTAGYDAFVQAAEINAKTWHRVRVAKLGRRQDALDMQKSLKNRFQQAFLTE